MCFQRTESTQIQFCTIFSVYDYASCCSLISRISSTDINILFLRVKNPSSSCMVVLTLSPANHFLLDSHFSNPVRISLHLGWYSLISLSCNCARQKICMYSVRAAHVSHRKLNKAHSITERDDPILPRLATAEFDCWPDCHS